MERPRVISPRRRTTASVLCIGLALVGVVLLGLWGAYRDVAQSATAVRRSAITRLNSHVERTVGRIETQLVEDGLGTDLSKLKEVRWLQRHISRTKYRQPGEIYNAVVDQSGAMILHSDPALEGEVLRHSKEDRAVESFGGAYVFETESPELTGGASAYDIRVPITYAGTPVGSYHAGLDRAWLDEQVASATASVRRRWIVVIGGILAVVVLAAASLGYITRRASRLQRQLVESRFQRAEELRQVMAGLAHEIRNPLNAVRLNLHTVERLLRGEVWLPEDEVSAMLQESTREIVRIADLMNDALGLARVADHPAGEIELGAEVQAACDLVRPAFEAERISLDVASTSTPLKTRIEGPRLRQVLLNLLNNAREAAGPGGAVRVEVAVSRHGGEVLVRDNGPGVAASDRQRVFDPFYSTKESGVGLGLAIARTLVESAGGQLVCDDITGGGAQFRVVLPAGRGSRLQETPA